MTVWDAWWKQPECGAILRSRDGLVYVGDSLDLMATVANESIDLVLTSPPFPLLREKEYGNVAEEQYVVWFDAFATEFKRILKPGGSLVIDLGGTYLRGRAIRSIYQYELLVHLVRQRGFGLAQEFFHYNPARLPTPAQWVNIERTRVKDSVNVVWWLSKGDKPKANNRKVLQAYSVSMENLLRNGYTPRLRPSGHDISGTFQRNNGGSIPPNLLSFANTGSNTEYLRHCRSMRLKPHPARFPTELPLFFIRFLTEVGDTVFDPFAGSLTTGYAAAILGRKWLCAEVNPQYVRSGLTRFWDRINTRGPNEFHLRKRLEPVVSNWFQ